MAEEKTYNGWKNYETWAVNLWLTNDEGTDKHWRATARYSCRTATVTKRTHTSWSLRECARVTLADALKRELEETRPDVGASLWADLLGSALAEVDWHRIADGFLDGEEEYAALPADE